MSPSAIVGLGSGGVISLEQSDPVSEQWTNVTALDEPLELDVSNYGSVGVSFRPSGSALTGGRIDFEVSDEPSGSNWYPIWIRPTDGAGMDSSYLLSGATKRLWTGDVRGFDRFRVKLGAVIPDAGAQANIRIQASAGSGPVAVPVYITDDMGNFQPLASDHVDAEGGMAVRITQGDFFVDTPEYLLNIITAYTTPQAGALVLDPPANQRMVVEAAQIAAFGTVGGGCQLYFGEQISSTVSGPHALNSNTLTLVNAASFSATGPHVVIGNDLVTYTSKSGNILQGVGSHPAYNGGETVTQSGYVRGTDPAIFDGHLAPATNAPDWKPIPGRFFSAGAADELRIATDAAISLIVNVWYYTKGGF